MFALIKTGGKQYRVSAGDLVLVEKIPSEPGHTVTLNDVLMIGDENQTLVGTPTIADASVTATVVDQTRAPKVIIFKKKRRHNYRRKKGHRQHLTMLRINDIAWKTA